MAFVAVILLASVGAAIHLVSNHIVPSDGTAKIGDPVGNTLGGGCYCGAIRFEVDDLFDAGYLTARSVNDLAEPLRLSGPTHPHGTFA
jgi:hypothetical protein